ncbi:MAG: fatty acyl-AMP ligase [Myxococcota bacterium]
MHSPVKTRSGSEDPARNSDLGNPGSLVEVLRSNARRAPGDLACGFLDSRGNVERQLTFAALDDLAYAGAIWLISNGAQGQRVLLPFEPGLDFTIAYLSCLYAGAVAVPLDFNTRGRGSARIRAIADDCEASIVVASSIEAAEQIAGGMRERPVAVGIHGLASIELEAPGLPIPSSSTLAMLQYTSGSTGNPKGVKVTHGNLWSNLEAIRSRFGIDRSSRIVSWLPHFHDMGLIGGILQPLYSGCASWRFAPLVFAQRPIRWLESIARFRGTVSGAPNFAYEHCIHRIAPSQIKELDLSSWQVAFVGGEKVRAQTIEGFAARFAGSGFRRSAFLPCYGLAESTLLVTGTDWRTSPKVTALHRSTASEFSPRTPEHVSCGTAVPDHKVIVVDPDRREICREGNAGEIWVRGPSVASGYWGYSPSLEREVFDARVRDDCDGEGFLRTGDVGVILADELYVTGRLKDSIVLDGVNYFAEDIEEIVQGAHSRVGPGRCVAFAVESGSAEELVVAVELDRATWRGLAGTRGLDAATLRAWVEMVDAIRGKVAVALGAQVGEVVPVPPSALPRTTSGKIARLQCRVAHATASWPQSAAPSRRSRMDSDMRAIGTCAKDQSSY